MAKTERKEASDLLLDEKRLATSVGSDQGDVYVLPWLYKVERTLKELDIPQILQVQSQLEKALLKLVSPLKSNDGPPQALSPQQQQEQSNPIVYGVPVLGRPSRNLIARCLVILFDKGESKSLYDVMQRLMQTAGDDAKGRIIPVKESKAGALYIAGEVFLSHGHNVMSQFSDLTLMCQRLFKQTSLPILVRYNALICLSKAIQSGGRSLNDQPAREILKSVKQVLNDRAGAVSRGSVECLLAMLERTNFLSNRSEIEQIISMCMKTLDTADFVTMRSLSRLIAILLAHTQKEGMRAPAVSIKKKKKKDNNQEESSEDEAGPSTASTDSQYGGGANQTIMTSKTMFDQLSLPFLRASTTKRGRGAILDVYATLFEQLGSDWVQTHYDVVLRHLIDDIPNHARGMSTRAEVLGIRIGVGLILRKVIGERMLGESAQVGAILEISTSFLKKYPVLMPGQIPSSKQTLALALTETSGLLEQLGSAPPQIVDALTDSLLRCLSHPSHSVQISAAWCLRTLCLYNPLQLTGVIESVFTKLNRDIASLNGAGERSGVDLPRRTNGHARGLAALISVIPQRPLYTSFEINTKVLNMSVELLKNSAEHSLAISAVEIQVAWVLIGALMSLGPNFARSHLNQLLNMWRSALPKPAEASGQAGNRSEVEWGFLLHVRECTLGSIYSFLLYNGSSLVTLDTAKKIISLLSNSLSFVNNFSSSHPHLSQEQIPGAERSSLTLLDREHMVRRRVFQCFSKLTSNPALEPLQESLVAASIQNFAEPDRYVGSAAQAAIAASAGSFTSIWSMSDGYAFGVTSLQRDAECFVTQSNTKEGITTSFQSDWLNRDVIEAEFDALQRRPIMTAAEHDPLVLYTSNHATTVALSSTTSSFQLLLPPPPATAAIDASLEVFSALLPFQKREVQISAFETLLEHSRSSKLERNPGRRMAIQVNACAAVLGTLRTAMQSGNRRYAAGFNNFRLTTALRELLKDALLQGDLTLRRCASEAFGRLAAVSGSHAMSSQVQFLVDQVVTNRDADARAGCALAFGSIYSEVGGLAAGPLTKTIVDILMSLANDPHPTVHFTALESLRMVVEAASLSYTAYVASTLGMLVKLYMLSTHEPEGGSAGSVNLRADLPAHQAIVRVISSVVGVLGPDLQDSAKIRNLILILLLEFSQEPEDGVVVEATKALQHFALFASQHMDLKAWIQSLRNHLKSSKRPLKVAAINGFYQLIQRHALMISKLGGNALVEDFFAQLDGDAAPEGVQRVLHSWLRQTADISPCGWIDLCQGIMSRVSTTIATQPQESNSDLTKTDKRGVGSGHLQDEEAAAIDLGEDKKGLNAQQSRWRTQLFALQCLHQVFDTVRKSGKLEHFDTPREAGGHVQMSSRVGDLIRMAFTASTAINSEIRLEGLTVLQDVIENFRFTRDPDFVEALLLEQHQAPIAAALTPAFTSDSTPEVLARAVQVCAVFVGSGVVREVEKLGRILKLLTRALENCSQASMQSLGDVVNLSSNASGMLKISILTAWGGLQVASTEQTYLVDVINPQLNTLTPLWIGSLIEFAHSRGDPEISSFGAGGLEMFNLDNPDASLIRNILMPHYQISWYTILHAISVLLKQDNDLIRKGINGEAISNGYAERGNHSIEEPALYFLALYGLTYESLLQSAGSAKDSRVSIVTLMALRYLTLDQYAGNLLLQEDLFTELINLYYRVVMVETPEVQLKVIEAIGEFIRQYGPQLLDSDVEIGEILPFKSKLIKCLHLVIYTLENTRDSTSLTTSSTAADKSILIRSCYTAIVDALRSLNPIQKEQILITAFHSYSELLRDESSEIDLVGPSLASLRELCIQSSQVTGDLLHRSIHGFISACVQTIDDMRARSGAIATNKTKNSMLAAVVVITSLPANFSLSQAVLEQYCFQIAQHLQLSEQMNEEKSQITTDSWDIAMTSINCLKTLTVATSRSSSPSLFFCIGQLLPLLVTYLIEQATIKNIQTRSSSDDKSPFVIVRELLKTLASIAGVSPKDTIRVRLIGVILPIMVLFLDSHEEDATSTSIESISSLAVQQILAMASQQPSVFRQVVALLNPSDRKLVETKIRASIGTTQDQDRNGKKNRSEAKKIALKSFG